jgi:hypothetical protein
MTIQEISKLADAQNILAKAGPGTWVLLDVDDTLITPSDLIFRYDEGRNPDRLFIDDYKKLHNLPLNTDTRHKFLSALSTWRMKRPIQLVEEGWPKTVNTLKKQGATVLALTQMDIGAQGAIPSMEAWRYDELLHHDLVFSHELKIYPLICGEGKEGTAHKGILMTGSLSKDEALDAYMKQHQETPKHIIFFDDRQGHVEALELFCQQAGIAYDGFIYKAAHLLPGTPDPAIVSLQKHIFLEQGEWVDDLAAADLVAKEERSAP